MRVSPLRRLARPRPAPLSLRQRRWQSTQHAESAPPSQPRTQQKPNPHSNFYKTFGRPLVKNFLIATAVFQALYYGWAKLESIEVKQEKEREVRSLQGEIEGLTGWKAETKK